MLRLFLPSSSAFCPAGHRRQSDASILPVMSDRHKQYRMVQVSMK